MRVHFLNFFRSVFELEMQAVRQTAVRDSVREQVTLLQQENREKREALRSLHTQWQSIMDFRQLVVRGSDSTTQPCP